MKITAILSNFPANRGFDHLCFETKAYCIFSQNLNAFIPFQMYIAFGLGILDKCV